MSAPAATSEPAGKLADGVVDPDPETLQDESRQPENKAVDDTESSQAENESQPGTILAPVGAPATKDEHQEIDLEAEDTQGPLIVDWNGPDDPENPRKYVMIQYRSSVAS